MGRACMAAHCKTGCASQVDGEKISVSELHQILIHKNYILKANVTKNVGMRHLHCSKGHPRRSQTPKCAGFSFHCTIIPLSQNYSR